MPIHRLFYCLRTREAAVIALALIAMTTAGLIATYLSSPILINIVSPDFSQEVQTYEIAGCRLKSSATFQRQLFAGSLIASTEHSPQMLSISGKKYIILRVNDLVREWDLSRDGTGGPRYAEAFDHRERRDIDALMVPGSRPCWGDIRPLSNDADGLVFIRNYGKSR